MRHPPSEKHPARAAKAMERHSRCQAIVRSGGDIRRTISSCCGLHGLQGGRNRPVTAGRLRRCVAPANESLWFFRAVVVAVALLVIVALMIPMRLALAVSDTA